MAYSARYDLFVFSASNIKSIILILLACAITGEGLHEGLAALCEMIARKRKLHKSKKKR